ncbi:MAG: type IX secretion system membrane protein PorP/SprF [Bacteroidia bacterium]
MKTLVTLSIVSFIVLSANAQETHFNNFYSASSYTNPAFAAFADYGTFSLLNQFQTGFYGEYSLAQVTIPGNKLSYFGSYLNQRNKTLGSPSTNAIEVGLAKKLETEKWKFSFGLSLNGAIQYVDFEDCYLPMDPYFENGLMTDFGTAIQYRNFQLGFAARNVSIIDVSYYDRFYLISIFHQIELRKQSSIYYSIVQERSSQRYNSSFNHISIGLRIKKLDLGYGIKFYNLGNVPKLLCAYSYKNLRIAYGFMNFINPQNDYYNHQQHELSLQFAFNTKGKEVSFLPF